MTAQEFLKNHGVDLDAFDNADLLAAFDQEMAAGLSGANSSLKMIPAFLNLPSSLPVSRKVAVLDAGGTNLRAARVCFDAAGKATIEAIVKSKMPGVHAPVSEEEFYAAFVDELEKVLEPGIDLLGFCFSYPAEITPEKDGKLLYWTKEIKAPAIVGQHVGAELKRRLAARGHQIKVAIMNDTVTTLLAGYAADPSAAAYVGFILGTGTNTALIVETDRIAKSPAARAAGKRMIVNTESGGFAKFPKSDFDMAFDAATQNPGVNVFEKCISGAYMGTRCLYAVKAAAKEGLFSPQATAAIAELEELDNKLLDDWLAGIGALPIAADWTADDVAFFKAVALTLYTLAARFTAVNIAAAVRNSGVPAGSTVIVNADGSTFYKTKCVDFQRVTREQLDRMLQPLGLTARIIHVDEAPILGAAVGALG